MSWSYASGFLTQNNESGEKVKAVAGDSGIDSYIIDFHLSLGSGKSKTVDLIDKETLAELRNHLICRGVI